MKLFLSSAQQLQSHTVCAAGYDVVSQQVCASQLIILHLLSPSDEFYLRGNVPVHLYLQSK